MDLNKGTSKVKTTVNLNIKPEQLPTFSGRDARLSYYFTKFFPWRSVQLMLDNNISDEKLPPWLPPPSVQRAAQPTSNLTTKHVQPTMDGNVGRNGGGGEGGGGNADNDGYEHDDYDLPSSNLHENHDDHDDHDDRDGHNGHDDGASTQTHQIHQMLSLSKLQRREFIFIFERPSGRIVRRHIHIQKMEHLLQLIQDDKPSRVEFGSIYQNLHQEVIHEQLYARTQYQRDDIDYLFGFRPSSRELVIDIDLTDYGHLRKCCEKDKICPNCWECIRPGMKMIEFNLRNIFGFQHILWFFSGRRGVHCFVLDHRARLLTADQRFTLSGFMSPFDKSSFAFANLSEFVGQLRPELESLYRIARCYFFRVAVSLHNLFKDQDAVRNIVSAMERWYVKPPDIWKNEERLAAIDRFAALHNYVETEDEEGFYRDFNRAIVNTIISLTDSIHGLKHPKWKVAILSYYMCARLDMNVTNDMTHPIQMPYCIHPKTDRAGVFIENLDTFDPFTVATISDFTRANIAIKDVTERESHARRLILFNRSLQAFAARIKSIQKQTEMELKTDTMFTY